MSRRFRATAFLGGAVVCAMLAASLAAGYGARFEDRYGPLRPVVVASSDLPAGEPIGALAAESLEIRRVPDRFLPAGALSDPAAAVGKAPRADIPRGAYLLAGQLGDPDEDGGSAAKASAGRAPVEIAVAGGGALAGVAPGVRVDVIVTTEPEGGAAGRTYIGARRVELFDLRQSADQAGGEAAAAWTATLALTRGQALRLIAAESFARQLRLLPSA